MSVVSLVVLVTLMPIISKAQGDPLASHARPTSPSWLKELVIYEIAPKTFTSPKGPESGTFDSLKARLPYLEDLGVTGIWLAGYALADPQHFFNIWMCYASVEPGTIDPSLGTPEQFTSLINEAHSRGIKIFLDVTTHGLMKESSVVRAHPDWFRGSSWGMIDFDWYGGHPELDDWWVKTWTDYVTNYGVDGFRLDLQAYRIDLWKRIRDNAEGAGHPIVIFEEWNSGVVPGTTDFSELENTIFQGPVGFPPEPDPQFANDVPGFYSRNFGESGKYKVEIEYDDGSHAQGNTDGSGILRVRLEGLQADKASRRFNDSTGSNSIFGIAADAPNVPFGDGMRDVRLAVDNVASTAVRNILVWNDRNETFSLRQTGGLWGPMGGRLLAIEGQAPTFQLYLPTLTYGSSIALSVHDVGGFRNFADNPYTARGSRALFGYSFLLTPMIPLFMAGEEFDATFHPIPWMSPDLYGAKDPGKGHMLYGSMLDWSELNQPRHKDMLEDVTRILAIRRAQWDVLAPATRGDMEPKLMAVPYDSDIEVPVPYMRWNGSVAIIVMANRNTEATAHLKVKIPVDRLSQAGNARYRVTDLWNAGSSAVYSAKELANYSYTIKRDGTPRGGLGLLKIELAP